MSQRERERKRLTSGKNMLWTNLDTSVSVTEETREEHIWGCKKDKRVSLINCEEIQKKNIIYQ